MDRPSGVRSAAERLRATIPIPCPSPGLSFLWSRGSAGSPRGGGSWSCHSDSGPPGAQIRRLVECIPGLVGLDRLVVEGVLVFALQDVAEHRAGMAVRRILIAGPEGHF